MSRGPTDYGRLEVDAAFNRVADAQRVRSMAWKRRLEAEAALGTAFQRECSELIYDYREQEHKYAAAEKMIYDLNAQRIEQQIQVKMRKNKAITLFDSKLDSILCIEEDPWRESQQEVLFYKQDRDLLDRIVCQLDAATKERDRLREATQIAQARLDDARHLLPEDGELKQAEIEDRQTFEALKAAEHNLHKLQEEYDWGDRR